MRSQSSIAFLAIVVIMGLVNSWQPVLSEENQIFHWKMVTTWPKDHPILQESLEQFTREVKLMSQGRLDIEVSPADVVVPALETFEAVSQGTVQMGHSASYYWAKKVPGAEFMSTIPFGMTAKTSNAWLYYGGGLALWRKMYEPFNVVPFPMGNSGVQMGGWFKKPITQLSDFVGVKIRMPGLGGEVLQKAGAQVVPLPPDKILSALEEGTIDAADWIGPYHDQRLLLDRAAQYYYYPGWHEPSTTLELIVNKKAWDTLPPALQKMIEVAAGNANQSIYAQFEALNIQGLRELNQKGSITIIKFRDEVLDGLQRLTEEVLKEKSSNNQFKAVYESYKKFLDDNNEWSRIADDAYRSGTTRNQIIDTQIRLLINNISQFGKARRQGDIIFISLNADTSFKTGSFSINKEAVELIRRMARTMLRYPSALVIVNGYTDNIGQENVNIALSTSRALEVRKILLEQGLEEAQIETKGHGSSNPIASNQTQEGQQKNRRVELQIIYKSESLYFPHAVSTR